MKEIVWAIVLPFLAGFALDGPVHAGESITPPIPYVLRSSLLQVAIDLETGSIIEMQDLARPESPRIFGIDEGVLKVAAGDCRPLSFLPSGGDPTSLTIASSTFRGATRSLPIGTTIKYRLIGNRLSIDYTFEALDRVDLIDGLDITISSSSWDTVYIRNQYSGEAPIVVGRSNPVRFFALNQVYELHNGLRDLSLVFPNPYHSLVSATTPLPHALNFKWHALVSWPAFQARDPKGPPIASVLSRGVKLHRQVEMILSHRHDEAGLPTGPIAYFSPFPNGYEQVIAMTFDDIPFGRWVFPSSGRDTSAPAEQYLIRLLEDHPNMKMGWIILPDEIFDETQMTTPGYPEGKWWLAHGKHRILTVAPPAYIQELRNIDRDSLVLGYENRVHLGSHGYHHTPEMLFGANYEFQSYDPTGNDSTFAAIAREFSLLGLHERSLKWIRFPGFYLTRSAVESLIKFRFALFDYWNIYDKLPWMQFYSDHGRIWGIGTWWQGDTPAPYEEMDKILRAGKLCHTSGHPPQWFDGDREASYRLISGMFQQAEARYPNLGYMFPDEVGFFADETCDIRDMVTDISCDNLVLSFLGAATKGQTIVLEWPVEAPQPTAVTVDGLSATTESRGPHFLIILPALADGAHVVQISADLCDWYDVNAIDLDPPSTALVLSQNYPNPFNPQTSLSYNLPRAAHVKLTIYNSAGERVAVLVDADQSPGRYAVRWDGRNGLGRKMASGIYFCRLEAGAEARVRKLVLVR